MSHTWKICICGHAEHEHEYHFRFGSITHTDCKESKCMCNEYELLKEMDFEEWHKFQHENEITDMFITSNEKQIRV